MVIPRYLGYLGREAAYAASRLKRRFPSIPFLPAPKPPVPWCAHFSPGMERIPHLSALVGMPCRRLSTLPGTEHLWPLWAKGCAAVAVWGHKDSRERAARFAARFNLPLLRLEDGFLRSLDLGVNGAAPLSLTADETGIYYDASRPSDLENLLERDGWESPELFAEARELMAFMLAENLSKYNHAPDIPPDMEAVLPPPSVYPRVLVIDQTAGDLSVELGLADAGAFRDMLRSARSEYPQSSICIKTHPDVLAGKKRGYLTSESDESCTADALPRLLATDVNPLSLLRRFEVIYTVSSQMGFEALLLGKTVHCFGLPFYAGWGLTRDRLSCPRRTRRRSIEELFAAAYLKYARYIHPATGERCSALDVARLLSEQRRRNEINASFHACVGFNRWKHVHARAFLQSTRGETQFFTSAEKAVRAASGRQGRVIVWAPRETPELENLCRRFSTPLWRMEDGFLRSVGLGAAYYRPGSLVLDDEGIYYNPLRANRLERILAETDFSHTILEQAGDLRQAIVQNGVTKYNVGDTATPPPIPAGKTVVLVPGQVEDDASVLLGGCGISSNMALLREVRTVRPGAFIIYKEHPDVSCGSRPGAVNESRLLSVADVVVRGTSMNTLLGFCHEVHTLTSLSGFEALLRGIPVWTYGGPFYAGWGLTSDRVRFERRKPLPSVDHLVAGALLLYPSYYDWSSRNFVDCASFARILATAAKLKKQG